ncbi:MAG: hypothetical protein EBS05_20550 [Proteobacteria bacterium]|nr:hypothetical protein [Pseudomonadota bacterium]
MAYFGGVPGDVWCAMYHICMDGHLYHKEMPRWWLYADFIWVAAFVAAAVLFLRSDVKRRLIPFSLLLFLVFSRMIVASFGGGLLLIEFPILIYLAVIAVLSIRRVRRQHKIEIHHEAA